MVRPQSLLKLRPNVLPGTALPFVETIEYVRVVSDQMTETWHLQSITLMPEYAIFSFEVRSHPSRRHPPLPAAHESSWYSQELRLQDYKLDQRFPPPYRGAKPFVWASPVLLGFRIANNNPQGPFAQPLRANLFNNTFTALAPPASSSPDSGLRSEATSTSGMLAALRISDNPGAL